MRSRAWRLHHESRIKHRVRQYYGGYAKDDPRHTGLIAHARQPCSCWMCGNPRRYWKERSLQERRAFQLDTLYTRDEIVEHGQEIGLVAQALKEGRQI